MSSYDDPEYRPKGARYGRPTFLEFLGIGSNYKPKMPMAAYSDYLLNRDPVGGRVERDQARKVYEAELALFEAENRRRDQRDIVDEYGKDAFRARTLLGYDPKDFKSFENPALAEKREAEEFLRQQQRDIDEMRALYKQFYGDLPKDIDRPTPEMANRKAKNLKGPPADRPTPEVANRKRKQKKAGGGRIKKTYAKGGGVMRKPKMGAY
jgi:hypothetical protein